MSAEPQELYQEVILDHNRRPRNFRAIEDGRKAEGFNPLCGDRVTIDVRLDGGTIAEITHEVRGCALCQASAVALGSRAQGRSKDDVLALRKEIESVLQGTATGEGDFAAFAPVRQYRSRHDCVLLPFDALQAALENS